MSSGSRVILISKSLIALAVAPLRRPLFKKRSDALLDVLGFEQFFQVNIFRPLQHGGKVFQRRLAQAFQRDSEHGGALAPQLAKQILDALLQLPPRPYPCHNPHPHPLPPPTTPPPFY